MRCGWPDSFVPPVPVPTRVQIIIYIFEINHPFVLFRMRLEVRFGSDLMGKVNNSLSVHHISIVVNERNELSIGRKHYENHKAVGYPKKSTTEKFYKVSHMLLIKSNW